MTMKKPLLPESLETWTTITWSLGLCFFHVRPIDQISANTIQSDPDQYILLLFNSLIHFPAWTYCIFKILLNRIKNLFDSIKKFKFWGKPTKKIKLWNKNKNSLPFSDIQTWKNYRFLPTMNLQKTQEPISIHNLEPWICIKPINGFQFIIPILRKPKRKRA